MLVTEEQLLECANVPTNLAAAYLHIGNRTLAAGLRQRVFPFGAAVQRQSGKWAYIIPPARLIAWARGDDIGPMDMEVDA